MKKQKINIRVVAMEYAKNDHDIARAFLEGFKFALMNFLSVDYHVGETVIILEKGSFKNFKGIIEEVDKRKKKLKLKIDCKAFEEPIYREVKFSQVEKLFDF